MTTLDFHQTRTGGRWTKEQHQKFLYGLKLYGKNWKKIEDLIQTRTSTQIRSHAQKFFIKIKKHQKLQDESQAQQNSVQSKFGQETQICPQEDKLQSEKSVFSFYFERIANSFKSCENQGEQFNFWTSLVDSQPMERHRSCEVLEIPHEFELDLRKVNSWNEVDTKKQSSSCELLRTQFSCFEEYRV